MSVPVVHFAVRGQARDAPAEPRPYTVVYDGGCNVCGRLANALRKWDRRRRQLEIIPSQASGVHARFPWIPVQAYSESLQLVGPNGETWQGAAAIEQLLTVLARGKLIAWVFKVPFVRVLADKFYRWFARNRYRLGCGEHCQLGPQQFEFIDQVDEPSRSDT